MSDMDRVIRHAEATGRTAVLCGPSAARADQLEVLADLLSRAWFHGDWEAETPAERDMEIIMRRLGYWPTTEDKISQRPEFLITGSEGGDDA
jgi:hypothetical protein